MLPLNGEGFLMLADLQTLDQRLWMGHEEAHCTRHQTKDRRVVPPFPLLLMQRDWVQSPPDWTVKTAQIPTKSRMIIGVRR